MMRTAAMIVGALLVSSTFALAMPDRTEKTDIGFQIGGLIPDSNQMNSEMYIGGSASYGITDWFALGIETGYGDARNKFAVGPTQYNTHLSHIPLFFDMIFRYTKMTDYNVVPYGVFGLGGVFFDVHGQGTLNDANLKLDVSNSFAIKLGAGADWFFNENWALNFEASYVWVDDDAKIRDLGTGNAVDTAGLDYWTVEGAIKYVFD